MKTVKRNFSKKKSNFHKLSGGRGKYDPSSKLPDMRKKGYENTKPKSRRVSSYGDNASKRPSSLDPALVEFIKTTLLEIKEMLTPKEET